MHHARGIYEYLKENGVIVRDRSNVHLCEDSLRITIGSSGENGNLITTLKELI
jgi:histidinol-phosphate aminotransferase